MKKVLQLTLPILGMLVMLLALVGQSSVVNAHANLVAGQWKLAGSLNIPRFYHAATLLKNDKVLIVGGESFSGSTFTVLASAELYDPSTGKWSFTGSMHVARYNQTATQLNNGEVLVAGGQDSNNNPLASAELYNPVTGKWSMTGNMNNVRFSHVAQRLQNGQVLVAGGEDKGNSAIASAELYNPSTGKWSQTSSMNIARKDFTATQLRNGPVLVAGGQGNFTNALASAELYNPSTGKWSLTGSMNQIRLGHTATDLNNGQILVAGGEYWSNKGYAIALASAELYNPAIGKWSFTGNMNNLHAHHTATLLNNGQVLVAGNVAQSELYDSKTAKWSLTGSMNYARELYTATRLNNGQVLAVGGQGNSSTPIAQAELFIRS